MSFAHRRSRTSPHSINLSKKADAQWPFADMRTNPIGHSSS
jgi:hypothetical protein